MNTENHPLHVVTANHKARSKRGRYWACLQWTFYALAGSADALKALLSVALPGWKVDALGTASGQTFVIVSRDADATRKADAPTVAGLLLEHCAKTALAHGVAPVQGKLEDAISDAFGAWLQERVDELTTEARERTLFLEMAEETLREADHLASEAVDGALEKAAEAVDFQARLDALVEEYRAETSRQVLAQVEEMGRDPNYSDGTAMRPNAVALVQARTSDLMERAERRCHPRRSSVPFTVSPSRNSREVALLAACLMGNVPQQ